MMKGEPLTWRIAFYSLAGLSALYMLAHVIAWAVGG